MKSANLQLLYGMKNLNSKTPEELDYYSEKFYEICHKTISLYQDYHKINKKAVGWRNQEIFVLEKKKHFATAENVTSRNKEKIVSNMYQNLLM